MKLSDNPPAGPAVPPVPPIVQSAAPTAATPAPKGPFSSVLPGLGGSPLLGQGLGLSSLLAPSWLNALKVVPIEARLKRLESEEQILKTSRWFAPVFAMIATLGAAAFLWFTGPLIFHRRDSPLTDARLYAGLILIIGFIAATSILVRNLNLYSAKRTDLEALRAEAAHNQAPKDTADNGDGESISAYFDGLMQGNQQYILQYYGLVKVQTDRSFQASLYAGGAGFALIALGLIMGFTDAKNSQIMAFVSSGSGVLTEFIAGVFFYLYNQTVRQMKGYHESLLAVQNLFLAFKLVGDTKDETVKATMISTMLTYLVGKAGEPLAPPVAKAAAA